MLVRCRLGVRCFAGRGRENLGRENPSRENPGSGLPDLNFACGGQEIKEISYEHGRISGMLDTPWYIPVTLTFLIPSETGFKAKQLSMSPGQRLFFLDY